MPDPVEGLTILPKARSVLLAIAMPRNTEASAVLLAVPCPVVTPLARVTVTLKPALAAPVVPVVLIG